MYNFIRHAVVAVSCLCCSQLAWIQAQDYLPDEQQIDAARSEIHEAALRGHIRFLADDLLEGRSPGSRGDLLAQRYIAAQFESLGLEPAAPEGGWYQRVPLVGVTSQGPPTLELLQKGQRVQLESGSDYIIWSGKQADTSVVDEAEFVFVGYGIEAPEYDWNDFKGVDVKGKILVMLNNDPSDDPELFAGRRRLYYGRWDYKYAMAARQGAAGAVIIHTTQSAGYPYQVVQTSWSGEQFELQQESGARLDFQAWFTEEAAQKLASLSGHKLADLVTSAQTRDFQPVSLGTKLSVQLQCKVRKLDTANVLAMLPGSHPERRKECVVFMAHHDHIGVAAQRDESGDSIYNGAMDNASGVAALLCIAKACARLKHPPERSILFATVGAEEQGLLGSLYFAQHPPVPAGYIAAVLNIDSLNAIGPTKDVNFIGYGKSSMDDVVRQIAEWQDRVVTPDQFPDKGYYYRSDQFSLAKIGVPGVYLHSGIHVIGKPEGWGKRRLEEWIQTTYHQPSDEYRDDWNLRGAVADVQLLFHAGLATARMKQFPSWKPGDEFEAARKAAVEARK